MRRRTLNSIGHPIEGINATPLIDVVMCLIVFFLLVGKMAADKGAGIRLPQTAVGELDKAADVIVVTVAGAPSAVGAPGSPTWPAGVPGVSVDQSDMNSPLSMETYIRSRLAERPLCVVQVRAERDLNYGQVQPVLAAIARGGATTVRLAMERAQ